MSGIYVHIPFCHSKCAYCDFYSTSQTVSQQRVVDAICSEYTMRRDELKDDATTIYFGGGTPSILSISQIQQIIDTLGVKDPEEVTIEVNPEDVDADKAARWREIGINRVSMGIQSLDDGLLKLIGRRHDSAQAIKAVETLRSTCFDNISLDLIYGLPGQDLDSWRKSLLGVLDLHPQHLSAYMLSYEPQTRLTAMLNAGKIEAVPDDTCIEMYQLLTEETKARGYEHYEISNFAQPGFEAKHNSNYWNSTPYLGLGPAAHSYDGKLRRINPNSIKSYLEAIESGEVACTVDPEGKANIFNDLLITALRTKRGINFAKVPRRRRQKLLYDAYPMLERGEILVEDNHFRIPEDKWMISDNILRELIQLDD